MSYLSVLPLTEVKAYLRIDDAQNEDDAGIQAMIEAASSYVEQRTGHILYARDKVYPLAGGDCIRVHDYPINSVVKGIDENGADVTLTDIWAYVRNLHTLYEGIDAEALVLNVGYSDPADVPSALKEVIKMLVKSMYYDYEAETFEDALSYAGKLHLSTYTRFLV